MHHKIIDSIINHYNRRPLRLHTIPLSIAQQPLTIQHLYEPFLIQTPFFQTTPPPTKPTPLPYQHFNTTNQNTQ
ncbi:Holliday junction DNA helicase RuvB C-terminal domain-containing protein [Staphylococcus epidermidis]|uniref:Holliday junction DNA helicase RuvB C-terminal domain-containing protein n=1 Tax=Staphylococcus epidermidis TaxID=1282 RepID=UPI0037DA28E3